MKNYHILADPHFNHIAMIDICNRPENFQLRLQQSLSQIPNGDIFICLWDFCIWRDELMHQYMLWALDCTKILIRWNHDKKSDAWYLNHGWDLVLDEMKLDMYGFHILFTHAPVIFDHYFFDEHPYSVNIHWHLHRWEHRTTTEDSGYQHYLVSCELQWYQTQTLQSIIRKHKHRCQW